MKCVVYSSPRTREHDGRIQYLTALPTSGFRDEVREWAEDRADQVAFPTVVHSTDYLRTARELADALKARGSEAYLSPAAVVSLIDCLDYMRAMCAHAGRKRALRLALISIYASLGLLKPFVPELELTRPTGPMSYTRPDFTIAKKRYSLDDARLRLLRGEAVRQVTETTK